MVSPFLPGDPSVRLEDATQGSHVEHLLGGEAALPRMLLDIRTAAGPTSFVYLASWNCQVDMPISTAGGGTDTLRAALLAAAKQGAEVRLLLWASAFLWPDFLLGAPKTLTFRDRFLAPRANNLAAQAAVNEIKAQGLDAECFLDSRTLAFGSHHQKIVVVGTEKEVVAYVGGIEFTSDRISDIGPNGKPAKGAPLFDVSMRVRGPAAHSLLRTFAERWVVSAIYPGKTSRDLARGVPLTRARRSPPPDPIVAPGATPSSGRPLLDAQVSHTYGAKCPFPNKIQTAARAIAAAIRASRSFFYMEDQYFIGTDDLGAAIRDTLRADTNRWGVIVIAAEDSVSDMPDVGWHRRTFVRPLITEFPLRFMVFERLGDDGTTTGPTAYVHSKLTIVDDVATVIGSANSSNRSWSHDTEVMLTLFDRSGPGTTDATGWNSVRAFRADIWQRHLSQLATVGPPPPLGNPDQVRFQWQALWLGKLTNLHVRPYPYGVSQHPALTDATFFAYIDPSG